MKKFSLSALTLICLGIYLFVSAPEELPLKGQQDPERVLNAAYLFQAVNSLNFHARRVYTADIVGKGSKAGLRFGEDWAEKNVDKGPLPALFLRELAAELEKKPAPLGLYLGSDAPINASNLFTDDSAEDFKRVVATRNPVYSSLPGYGTIAMFPDVAAAAPCVSCHNEHPDSPKTDWKLNDVMGATTWTWPTDSVSPTEIQITLQQTIEALQAAYEGYLAKTKTFSNPPSIGKTWPDKGNYAIPDSETYLERVLDQAAPELIQHLLRNHDA